MFLRGGGCGSSKKPDQKQIQERKRGQQKLEMRDNEESPKLAKSIDHHIEIITKYAKLAESESGKLQMSFQFFTDNSRELWKVATKNNRVNQLYDIIFTSMNPLLAALESLVIGQPYFALQLAQAISSLTWILFSFYLNNDQDSDRYMTASDQDDFLGKIERIEELVDKESDAQKYQNNLQFEIYIFKSIITICPNNKTEGSEILQLFVAGAIKSVITFTLDSDLLASLQRGVIYLYNEHEKASCKRLLKIIFSLIDLKFIVIDELENAKEAKDGGKNFDYLQSLSILYEKVVSKSSDWQVQCAWIQTLSQIFQHKLIIPAEKLMNHIETNSNYIHKLSDQSYWLNIDSKAIEKDPKAKLLYENLANLQELGRFQYLALNGYQQMPGFEQLYFSKLASQIESQNYNLFDFTLNTVSTMLHQAQQFQNYLTKILQQIRLLSPNNLSKLKEIASDIKKAIDCNIYIMESIQGLNEYEKKLQFYESSQGFKDQKQDTWYQEDVKIQLKICKEFVQFFLKAQKQIEADAQNEKYMFDCSREFIIQNKEENHGNQNNNSQPLSPQEIQQQPHQILQENDFNDRDQKINIIKLLDMIAQKKKQPKSQKQPTYDKIVLNIKTEPKKIDNLLQLQQKLKFVKIDDPKIYRLKDDNFLQGFNQGIKFIKSIQSFIKWNLRILIFLKFLIEELLLEQYSKDQINQRLLIIQLSSLQLSNQKSVIRVIKYFYRMFQTCEKLDLIKKLGQKNVIYNVLHTISIRKFKTQNTLMEIYKELIGKIQTLDTIYLSSQIFSQIQNDLSFHIKEISQISRAMQMVNDLVLSRNQKNNQDNSEFKILSERGWFLQIFENPINQTSWSKNRDAQIKLQQNFHQFNQDLKLWQSKSKFSHNDELVNKQKAIANVLQKIEILQQYQTVTEKDTILFETLVIEINQELVNINDKIINLEDNKDNQLAQDAVVQEEEQNQVIFQELKEFLSEAEHSLLINFENLKFINKEQGVLQQLIHNTKLLEQNFHFSNSQIIEEIIQNNKSEIKKLIEEYEKVIPPQIIDCKPLEEQLKKARFIFPQNLQSEIYFILTQVGKKEDITSDPSYYDKFKEAASDFITKNKWRIRQFCIFELLMFRKSCLSQQILNQCNALFIKYKIYETDSRSQLLLSDQTQEELAKMLSQCWSSSEDEVQNKIKAKLEELNDIAYKITIETKQYEKEKLKKNYMELEKEIQGIIKNVEGLGSSIGTSILFFQDLKKDLVNIQAQLNNLQSSIDKISKDISYLKGRTVKDLLLMRMQRILQQRLVINSESVYVQIKTKENFVLEDVEDDETPLLTDDLFGDGEINEFIWKQQKLSFLIHGKAGSGKSTAARKIEEFLWLLYKKNMNIPESTPLIPIFISLPQLKDPQYSAMEETLKSDNYRFSEKQVYEFLEAVENDEFKLIIIMDSYDELNSQFIGSNLNQTNKFSKWRSKLDEMRFPKIITTSRSEIFTNNDYRTWFLQESENIKYYKEVSLQNFDKQQVHEFIEQHSKLNVKKVIKEFYFNQKENQGFFGFEEIFEGIPEVIEANSKNEQSNFLLSQDKISAILEKINFKLQEDEIIKVKQQLSEIWSASHFQKLIEEMDIIGLLETPFMIEIVTQVLPQMNMPNLKERFIITCKSDAQDIWNKIQNNQNFLNQLNKYLSTKEQMELVSKNFSDSQMKKYIQQLLRKSLRLNSLCSYDFYQQFFQQYFKKQINKLREAGEDAQYVQNDSELWEFTHRLANQMTFNNLTQVKFQPKGLIFKKQKEDWRDIFFNDDCDQGPVKIQFRRVMPLRQKFGIFSFQHKSLQEFLVAKWFIQFLERYEDFNKFDFILRDEDIDLNSEIFLNISFCHDFMKGIVKFIIDKLKFDGLMQRKLHQIVKLSSQFEYVRSQKVQENSSNQRDNNRKKSFVLNIKNTDNQKDCSKESMVIASSNCLYLLHLMKFKFQDLQNIKIQNIDLIGANFYQADLSYSQFSEVNLSKSNFNATNLDNIVWEKILIDELPSIETQQQNPQIFYFSPIDEIIVYKSEYEELSCYNYKTGDKVDWNKLQILQKYDQKIIRNIVLNQNNDYIILIFDELEIIIINLGEKISNDLKFKIDITIIENPNEFVLDEKKICLSSNLKHLAFINSNNLYLCQLDNKQNLQPALISEEGCWQVLWLTDNELILQKYTSVELIDVATQVTLRVLNCEKYEIDIYDCIEVGLKKFLLGFSYKIKVSNGSTIKILDQKNQILKANEKQMDRFRKEHEQFYKEGYEITLEEQNEVIQLLKFVENDKYLLSFSLLKQKIIMRLWNFREKKLISSNIIDSDKAFKPLLLPNSLVSTVDKGGKIQIWDMSVCFLQQNEKISVTITSVIFAYNCLISGNDFGIIQVWDEEKGTQVGNDLKEHKASITCLANYQSETDLEQILVSCDQLGNLIQWNLEKQEILQIYFLINPIDYILVMQNGEQFITLSKNTHFIQIWENNFTNYKFILKGKSIDFRLNDPYCLNEECAKMKVETIKYGGVTFNKQEKIITCIATSFEMRHIYIGVKDNQKRIQLYVCKEELGLNLTKKIFYQLEQQNEITLIKEINKEKILIVARYEIMILQKNKITPIMYQNQSEDIQPINDACIDDDLLMFCSNNYLYAINLTTNKAIIQQKFEQQFDGIDGVGALMKLSMFRQNYVLFIGTSTGILIEYDLMIKKIKTFRQQHNESIIYMKILKKNNQLLTCGKDRKIIIQQLSSQQNNNLKIICLCKFNYQINQIWYDEVCKIFVVTSLSERKNDTLDLYCLIWDFNKQDSKQVYIKEMEIGKEQLVGFVERRQQIYLTSASGEKIEKILLLQEKLKYYEQIKNGFIPNNVLNCQDLIIVEDIKQMIYCWNENEKNISNTTIQLYHNGEVIEGLVFDYSQIQKRLVFFYLLKQRNEITHIVRTYLVQNATFTLEKQFILTDKIDQTSSFTGSKINSVRFLSEQYILVTFTFYEYETFIVDIRQEKIVDKIKDHLGNLVGSISQEFQNSQGSFATFGAYNQISYYQLWKGWYSEKYKLGDSIKKFSCVNVAAKNCKLQSNYVEINMKRLLATKDYDKIDEDSFKLQNL